MQITELARWVSQLRVPFQVNSAVMEIVVPSLLSASRLSAPAVVLNAQIVATKTLRIALALSPRLTDGPFHVKAART
jgi:hypothetical protein